MLTDTACKKTICPADKARLRLSDSGGLYLQLEPSGSRRWFWKYRFEGKEKRLALGSYPEVTLKAARNGRDDARKIQQQGIDPAQRRQLDKLERKVDTGASLEAVAREYHKTKSSSWSRFRSWRRTPSRGWAACHSPSSRLRWRAGDVTTWLREQGVAA